MTIPARNVSITGVFAENATTTIPEHPSPGVSYRDSETTAAQMNAGFAFKTIVDSSKFNQALYEYSFITQMQEKYGFIPWSNLTDYVEGSVCIGTDGVVYQAKQATGPSSTAFNPVDDNSHTYWDILYTKDVVTIWGTQTITGDKAFTGELSVQNASSPALPVKNLSLTKGTNPSSAVGVSWLRYTDANGNNMSSIYSRVGSNGDVSINMVAYLNTAGVNTNAQLGITYKKDGTVTTTCPPSNAINSILTTTGITTNEFGTCFELGNGLKIQWGTITQFGNTSVEFPVPFTSVDSYSMGDIGEHSYGEYTFISDLTNEGFIAHLQTGKPFRWIAIGT